MGCQIPKLVMESLIWHQNSATWPSSLITWQWIDILFTCEENGSSMWILNHPMRRMVIISGKSFHPRSSAKALRRQVWWWRVLKTSSTFSLHTLIAMRQDSSWVVGYILVVVWSSKIFWDELGKKFTGNLGLLLQCALCFMIIPMSWNS